MTKIATATPKGDCPTWRQFLATVTGNDPQLQAYLARVIGYALTGVTVEHARFFLYGTGANGKSVFVNTIAAILGDYATNAAMDTFMATQGERHPTDLASLRGAARDLDRDRARPALGREPAQVAHRRRQDLGPVHAPGRLRVHPAVQAGRRREP
jgi:P4 family phage/plasmid primase-like protien